MTSEPRKLRGDGQERKKQTPLHTSAMTEKFNLFYIPNTDFVTFRFLKLSNFHREKEGSRDGAVVRALTSLWLVVFLAPRCSSSPGSLVIPIALEPTFNYKF